MGKKAAMFLAIMSTLAPISKINYNDLGFNTDTLNQKTKYKHHVKKKKKNKRKK